MVESRFGRCDGCRSERTVYRDEDRWLCKGPNRCYQHRKTGQVLRKKGRS